MHCFACCAAVLWVFALGDWCSVCCFEPLVLSPPLLPACPSWSSSRGCCICCTAPRSWAQAARHKCAALLQVAENLYGQDLDSGHHGSGFPLPPFRQKLLEQHLKKQAAERGPGRDREREGSSGSEREARRQFTPEEVAYSEHPWNINNLPRCKVGARRSHRVVNCTGDPAGESRFLPHLAVATSTRPEMSPLHWLHGITGSSVLLLTCCCSFLCCTACSSGGVLS